MDSCLPTGQENIFLIGNIDTQMYGNKLPCKGQVLKVLFFNLRQLKLTIREAAILIAKEIMIFWEKARLPIKKIYRCADMVESLYGEWRNLQKNAGQPFNAQKELEFKSELQNLFDISPPDVFAKIDELQKEFLTNQRKPGRVGYISDVETFYDIQERAQLEKEDLLMRRLQRSEKEKDILSKYHWDVLIILLKHVK